jgi:glycosyltransferase involved in cell wall biosynthesis
MQAGVPDVRQSPPSGPASHVLHTIRGLTRLGHNVRLVANLDGGIWRSDDLASYTRVRLRWLEGRPFRLAERAVRRAQAELQLPYMAWFDSLRFAEACYEELAGFDLIYERMGWLGRGGSWAARRLGVPHVLEINGDHVREHELLGFRSRPLQARLSAYLMRKVALGATHAVATGEGWRRCHLQHWPIDPARTSVIQNGSEVVDLLSRDQLRSWTNYSLGPKEPLRLIYVGSFDPWQNLPLLLGAVSRSLHSGIDVRLTLAGSGKMRDSLEQTARELQIGNSVTFTGHLPMTELARILAESDVGVSLYDGREEFDGLKLLDYKSAGLATIATGKNGEPAVLRHNVTAVIIPPGDEDALVRAIHDLDAGRERVVRMGRQARLEAEQKHGWRHTTKALESLFYSIVHGCKAQALAVS